MGEQRLLSSSVAKSDETETGLLRRIGDPDQWLRDVEEDYQILVLAAASMKKSDRRLAANLTKLFENDAEAGLEYLDRLKEVTEKYERLALMLSATQKRWRSALSDSAVGPQFRPARGDRPGSQTEA